MKRLSSSVLSDLPVDSNARPSTPVLPSGEGCASTIAKRPRRGFTAVASAGAFPLPASAVNTFTAKSFSAPTPPASSGATTNSKYPSSEAVPTRCVARTMPVRGGVVPASGSGAAPLLWWTLNSAETVAGAPPVHSHETSTESRADAPGFRRSVATVAGADDESVTFTLLPTLADFPASSIIDPPPTYVSPPAWYPPLT